MNLLTVKELKKYFPVKKGIIFSKVTGYVKAVDGINFSIGKGETLGLVGESGCGKSTAGRLILRLLEPTEGKIFFNDRNILELKAGDMNRLRKEIQVIFQDPYASLNPRMTVGDIIGEPLDIHRLASGKERTLKIKELLNKVGLSPSHINRYPHEFSGGQRQRIGIARALSVEPRFIIADEPVSALDVSIQAQIINLLSDLQKEMGLTYLFISHDLSVVKHISNRVGVMYLGKLMEIALSEELYDNPLHPYTKALLSAIPDPDNINNRILLEGDVPGNVDIPSGCRFRTRCWLKEKICIEKEPDFLEIKKEHFVACHIVSRECSI
ncbi:MAG: oligopeptide/dipeptide ABC transporter ATP-binding protein [Candidatus Eremiobacterota bacterium]